MAGWFVVGRVPLVPVLYEPEASGGIERRFLPAQGRLTEDLRPSYDRGTGGAPRAGRG